MSYDISLINKETKETVFLKEKHHIAGGTYAFGGTQEAWLNVTYNYSKFFYKVLGEKGIRTIYGMTAKDSIPVLKEAIAKLKDDTSIDYWEATEGNAKEALKGLLNLAELAPEDSVWDGD